MARCRGGMAPVRGYHLPDRPHRDEPERRRPSGSPGGVSAARESYLNVRDSVRGSRAADACRHAEEGREAQQLLLAVQRSDLLDAALPLVVVRDLQTMRATLLAEFPHAATAINLMLRDLRDDRPFRLKPVCLVGSPGTGKSRLVRRLSLIERPAQQLVLSAAPATADRSGGYSRAVWQSRCRRRQADHAIALLTLRDASFQPDPTGEPSARDLVGRGDGDR